MRTILGLRMIDVSSFDEAQDAIKPIQRIALEGDYKKRVAQINAILGTFEYGIKENFPSAFIYLSKAVETSEKSKDLPSIALSSYWMGFYYSLNCEFEKAEHFINRCLEYNIRVKHESRISVMKSLLSLLAYFYNGKIEKAFALSKETIDLSEQSGDIFSKAFAHSTYGVSCYGKGLFEEATDHLLKGAKLAEKIGQRYLCEVPHHFLGEICFYNKNYSAAKYHFNKTITYMEKFKYFPTWLNLNKLALARVETVDSEAVFDHELLVFYDDENKVKKFKGWTLSYLAEILLNLGGKHLLEAENLIKKAIEANQKNGMMFQLGKDYTVYSKLLKKKENIKKAKEKLNKAIDIFNSCNADGWVEQYEKVLANT